MPNKYLDDSGLSYFFQKLQTVFQAKESGKGLSSNDYTTIEKTKLSGIDTSAQVNVIETVKKNGATLTVTNKAVDISVPTKISDLTNDSDFVEDPNYVHTDNNYTSAEKTKLAGIDVVSSSNNGLCPQLPSGSGQSKYLCEDGTWRSPATSSSGLTQFYDDTITNASSDWSNRRCSVYKVSGTGFINISASVFQVNNASYGNIDLVIQHSTDNGSTWTTDILTSHRHDSNQADVRDGLSANYAKVASNNELIRVTWYLSKEDARIARITVTGESSLTITRTINGEIPSPGITLP